MTIVTITPPTAPPLTTATVKGLLNVDHSLDDSEIDIWLDVASAHAENFLNRRLMPQTVELRLDGFPAFGMSLGVDPIRTVTSIKYDDADDVEQTLATSVYETDLDRLQGWVQPKTGQVWPATYDKLQAVRIRMEVGFADEESVPAPIKHGIALFVGHYLENREATVAGNLVETPEGAKAHWWPLRIVPI